MGYFVKNRQLTSGSTAIQIPVGDGTNRPAYPVFGMIRYNTSIGYCEFYNGSIWQNADPDVSIASAVFATNAQSDLGSVTDLVIGTSENLGLVTEVAAYIYNMGTLVVDGIVSLNNIDQSIKADYIAYSIIFGF